MKVCSATVLWNVRLAALRRALIARALPRAIQSKVDSRGNNTGFGPTDATQTQQNKRKHLSARRTVRAEANQSYVVYYVLCGFLCVCGA